jgi:hypothetical protein
VFRSASPNQNFPLPGNVLPPVLTRETGIGCDSIMMIENDPIRSELIQVRSRDPLVPIGTQANHRASMCRVNECFHEVLNPEGGVENTVLDADAGVQIVPGGHDSCPEGSRVINYRQSPTGETVCSDRSSIAS